MALLPCPWAGSEPRSTEQPNLSVKLRTFTCFLKRCVKGIEAYPYEPLPGKPDQIPYYEMLGLGPPPKDVPGNPGDIYIDQISPIVLYVRNRNQWEKWNDPLVADNEIDGFFPASHPLIANRYLGKTSSSRRLSWYMGSSLWAAGLSVRRPIRLVACNDSVGGFRFESTVSKEPHKTPSTLVPSQPRSTGSISISRSPYKKRKIEEVDLMKESSADLNARYDHLTEESPDVILLKESSNDSLHSSDASIVASAKDLLAYVSRAEEKQRLLSKREKAAIDKLTRVQKDLERERRQRRTLEAQKCIHKDTYQNHEAELVAQTTYLTKKLEQQKKAYASVEARLRKQDQQFTNLKSQVGKIVMEKSDAEAKLKELTEKCLAQDKQLIALRTLRVKMDSLLGEYVSNNSRCDVQESQEDMRNARPLN